MQRPWLILSLFKKNSVFKKLSIILTLFSLTLLADGVQKAVHHCDYDDDKRFEIFMATLLYQVEYYNQNLQEFDLQIVINGACMKYVSKKHKNEKFISMLQSRIENYGIKVHVCKSGMKAAKVEEKDISIKGTNLVSNGSAKLTELQNSGFAYKDILV